MASRATKDAWTFVGVYLVLVALLAGNVALAFVPMGRWNAFIALSIATFQALLIVIFFMHLRRASGVVRLASVSGLIWLTLLFGLALSDYLTRPGNILVRSPGWQAPPPRASNYGP